MKDLVVTVKFCFVG